MPIALALASGKRKNNMARDWGDPLCLLGEFRSEEFLEGPENLVTGALGLGQISLAVVT